MSRPRTTPEKERRSGYACTLSYLKEAGLRPTSNESDWSVEPGGDQTRICQVHSTCSVESGLSETETGGRVARSKAKAETPARRRGGLDPGRGGGLGRRGRIQKLRSWEN